MHQVAVIGHSSGASGATEKGSAVCARRLHRARRTLVLVTALLLSLIARMPVVAQAAELPQWNGARVLSLMELARERRQRPLADTALQNYQARAEGLVYFYLDRQDVDERVLVRTDQVGLEVYWAQPDRSKQRIVGMRGENSLPNRMLYHLDHLTVVQNGFGNLMRMGDGDEVSDVPHPAAPRSDTIYDFRLADSLELRLPGASGPIKAYEVNVRPKQVDRPAFVGSVFVDHATGDIVRMTFTFTRVSYVDRRLDFINISMDNSLWQGRYWLPYEQAVEIRRQVPELDFIVSSVIQARFRVWDYRFNEDLPDNLFWGYRVTTVPRAERESYEFDRAIFDDLHDAGLAPPASLKEIRARAAELVRQRALSGLPRLRLSLPNASAALRYNRAESLYLGWGAAFTPGATRLEVLGGFRFGPEQPVIGLGARRNVGESTRLRADAYLHEMRDIGVRAGMPGALNTLTSSWGDDYFDPFFASGGRFTLDRVLTLPWRLNVRVHAESHESATLEQATPLLGDSPFRPVRDAEPGTSIGIAGALQRDVGEPAGFGWGGRAEMSAGSFDGRAFAIPVVDVRLVHGSADRRSGGAVRLAGGVAFGSPAPQQRFLMGGRNTVPGYTYRSFGGDAFALADIEAGRDLWYPFVRVRILGAAGWTGNLDPVAGSRASGRIPATWNAPETDGLRTAVGVGGGFFYDLLRIDLVRGLNRRGQWQVLLSLDPKLWPVL